MALEHRETDGRIEVLSRPPRLVERMQRLRSHRQCFDVHSPMAGGSSRIDERIEQRERRRGLLAPQFEPRQCELPAESHAR
jgi:hypothetical protein